MSDQAPLDAHIGEHHRERLVRLLTEFMEHYRATLVREVRTSVPMLMSFATSLEKATTWQEIVSIEVELLAWMATIRGATRHH